MGGRIGTAAMAGKWMCERIELMLALARNQDRRICEHLHVRGGHDHTNSLQTGLSRWFCGPLAANEPSRLVMFRSASEQKL